MVGFAELPQDVYFLIIGKLDALSSMNLSLVCKAIYQLRETRVFWLVVGERLNQIRPLAPTTWRERATDVIKASVCLALCIEKGWREDRASLRTLPPLDVDIPLFLDEFHKSRTSWIILLDDGDHLLMTERDSTFKLRRVDTGALVKSIPLHKDYRHLSYEYTETGVVLALNSAEYDEERQISHFEIWDIPFDTTPAHCTYTVEVQGCAYSSFGDGPIVGCATGRNSQNVWIYLHNWKESTELSVKIDHTVEFLSAGMTSKHLTILHQFNDKVELLAYDVEELSRMMRPANHPSVDSRQVEVLSPHRTVALPIADQGLGLSIGGYPTLLPIWSHDLMVIFRSEPVDNPEEFHSTIPFQPVVYALMRINKDVWDDSNNAENPTVVTRSFVRRLAICSSLDGNDTCVVGRGGKTTAWVTVHAGPTYEDECGPFREYSRRLRFFDLPGPGDQVEEKLDYLDEMGEDGWMGSFLQDDPPRIGKTWDIVNMDILQDMPILSMDLDDSRGRVAFAMPNGSVILLEMQ